MAIEQLKRDSGGDDLTCTGCPFCGEDLGPYQSLAKHIRSGCKEADA